MNVHQELEQFILEENRENHERSVCLECTANLPVTGGSWVANGQIDRDGKVGIPVYIDSQSTMVYPPCQSVVIGSTGTGKTTTVYHNMIDYSIQLPYGERPSFCVTDLKGDILPLFRHKLEQAGYTVLTYDMKNCFFSAQYNPLLDIYDMYQEAVQIKKQLNEKSIRKEFCGQRYSTTEEARAAAQVERLKLLEKVSDMIQEKAAIIVPDSSDPKNLVWSQGARTCYVAILNTMLRDSEDKNTGMTRENFTIANSCKIAFHTEDNYSELIEWLRRADDIPVVSSALGSCYDIRATVTRDGYVSSLNTELGKFATLSIEALTATADALDWQAITSGERPYAIFIQTDDRRPVTNQVCAMLINDLIHALTDAADKNPNGALTRDFFILCDEFANMPKLPMIVGGITTLRSRKVWIMMAVQSIRQLEMVYGEKEKDIILDNCDLTFYLGCNHDETKEFFSKSMGDTIGIEKSVSYSANGSVTVNTHTRDMRVVKKSDLSLPLGTFYVKARQYPNLKTHMLPYFVRNDGCPVPDRKETRVYNGFDPEQNRYDIRDVLQKSRIQNEDETDFNFNKFFSSLQSKKH